MPQRLRIGLTGGIASGKSTVEKRFMELGIPVINADDSSRAVVAPGEPGLAAVAARFGDRVLTPAGELDRRALRARVFADPVERRALEGILHPLIKADMERRTAAAVGPYVIMSIPLLIEGGARDRVDRILVIYTDEAVQLARLMARDSVDIAEARAILAAQGTREARLQAADDILANSGSVAELHRAVDRLHERYLRLAAARAAGTP
jgi:dephospho-CoA kinase